MYATEKQPWLIKKLAAERKMDRAQVIEGWNGDFGRSLSSRTIREASGNHRLAEDRSGFSSSGLSVSAGIK